MVRLNGAKQRAQRGFTLLEMMIVVVVIAILAVIVVPTFFRESRKTKAITEVTAMFAELAMKLEQYKGDNGAYVSLAECPTTTTPAGTSSAPCATAWAAVRVAPTATTLRCKYQVTAGPGSTTATGFPGGFTFASPAAGWYWMIATCDGDGNTTTNATFFANSVDARIQAQNEAN